MGTSPSKRVEDMTSSDVLDATRPVTRSATPRRADGWDRHVANRVRDARLLKGLTQAQLGEAAGISCQQIQKYEKGLNRIAPSRLVQFAKTLEVTPGWFFEVEDDLVGEAALTLYRPSADAPAPSSSDMHCARLFSTLPPHLKRKMSDLLEALASDGS